MSFERMLITAALLLTLGGCNTANSHIGSEDPHFGEAVKYDAALQIINPAPVYAPGGALPGDDAAKGVAASTRYRTDTVKEVVDIKTTSSVTGSGGGGSGPH